MSLFSSNRKVLVTEQVIYFEKQFGSLCGVHCLNNAVQFLYFTEVDLAEMARMLDEEELRVLGPSGVERVSANYNDAGDFSVQVLQHALQTRGMDMAPFFDAPGEEPRIAANEILFIVNMDNHWFCYRRFRNNWVELNSLNDGPKFISHTYVNEYLATVKEAGHSVFVVTGDIPVSNGDCWMEFDRPQHKEYRFSTSRDTAREGEEVLTQAQIVRRRREALLQNLEKKMAGVTLGNEGGASGGPSTSAGASSSNNG